MAKTRSIPYWTASFFSSAVTDLVLIYESVTSSASVVRWIIQHSISVFSYDWMSLMLRPKVRPPVCLGIEPDSYYCQTVVGLLMWGALSDERTGLSFTIAVGPRQRNLFGAKSRGTRDHILVSQIRDFPFRRVLRLAGLRWSLMLWR
jgi:hypothetical protein